MKKLASPLAPILQLAPTCLARQQTPVALRISAAFLATLALLFSEGARAAVSLPFYDTIPSTYTTGGNLGAAGVGNANWTLGANTTNIVVTTSDAQSFTGLLQPPSGSQGVLVKKISNINALQYVGVNFSPVSSGTLYASFLLKVNARPTAANRCIAAFSTLTTYGNIPDCAVELLTSGKLGVARITDTVISTTQTAALTVGTTYFVVVRYNFVAGANNDTIDLWLNPAPGSLGVTEGSVPAATIPAFVNAAQADPASLQSFFIPKQASGSDPATWSLDEFRVGTTWASVTPAVPTAYKVAAASSTPTAGGNDQLTITLVDDNGNTVTSFNGDKTLTFSNLGNSPSGAIPTVTDKNGNPVNFGTGTTITFVNGVSSSASGAAVLVAKNAATSTIHVNDGALTDQTTGGSSVSLGVAAAASSKLAFTTSPQTFGAGSVSGTITVQRQDLYSNVNSAEADLTVYLTTTSASGLFRDVADATTITSVTIPNGSGAASFKYRDATAGTPTVTAADQVGLPDTGLTDATQMETVTSTAKTWVGGAGNQWNHADANWSGGQTFSDNDAVIFDNTGSQSPPVNISETVQPVTTTVNSGTYTFGGAGKISGTGSVTVSGTGSLALDTANDYSGETTLTAGTLALNNATPIGSGTFTISGGTLDNTSGGPITLANNNAQAWNGDFAFTGTGNLNLGTGAVTPNASRQIAVNGGNLAVGGAIGGGSIGLAKTGTGSLALSGVNTFSGGVTLSAGTLDINSSQALGTGTFTVGGGSIDNTSGGAITVSANNPQNWNADLNFLGGSDLNLGAGPVTLNASHNISVNAATLTVGGSVGGGAFGLTKSGAGTLVLAGANAYGGATTVSSGTVKVSSDGNLGAIPGSTTPASIVLNGGVLSATSSFTLNSKRGLALGSSGGSGTVDVASGQTLSYSGIAADNGGAGALVKSGPGTLTLSGANTYSGGTTISAGTLQLGGSGSVSGDVTDNGVLNFSQSSSMTFAGNISGSGTVTQSGTASLNLTGNNSYDGITYVNSGALWAGSANALGSTVGDTEVSSGASLVFQGADLNITVNEPIKLAGSGFAPFSALDIRTSARPVLSGPLTLTADTVVWVSPTAFAVFNNPNAFTSAANQNLILSGGPGTPAGYTNAIISGAISLGSGGLTVTGPSLASTNGGGKFILSGANNYTGPTALAVGTLVLANNNALGASPAVTVGASALPYTALQLSGGITTPLGTTAILNSTNANDLRSGIESVGTNTWTGPITLQGDGVVYAKAINAGDALTLSGNITDGSFTGRLILRGAGAGTISGALSLGAGALDVRDGAIWTLAPTSSAWTGGTFASQGTLQLGGNNALPVGTTLTIGSASAGSGNTIGIFDLAGYNQQVHGLTTSGTGTPQVIGNSSTGSDSLLTFSGGTNSFSGIIQDALASGTYKVALSVTAGSLTLSGNNTYSGNTTLSGGSLALAAPAAIADSPVITIASGSTLDASALGGGWALGTAQTLVGGSAGASTVLGDVTLAASAQVSLTADGSASTVAKLTGIGALTANNNTININVTGSPLGIGTYRLIDAATVSGSCVPNLTGLGLAPMTAASIANGSGGLDLVVSCVTPTTYNVAGGGEFCASAGADATVTLGGSQTAVSYQLKLNAVPVGLPSAGTGSPLSWPHQTAAGAYTVEASVSGSCVTAMAGNAMVVIDPASVGGAASPLVSPVCAGTGTSISLTGQTGTILKWQSSTDGGSQWTDIASAANPLSTGNLTQTTEFRAVVQSGVCSSDNSTLATVVVDPLIEPSITSIQMLGDGSAQLVFTSAGPACQTYQVLASEDLAAPSGSWDVLSTGTFTTSTTTVTDTDAPHHALRFYRIISP